MQTKYRKLTLEEAKTLYDAGLREAFFRNGIEQDDYEHDPDLDPCTFPWLEYAVLIEDEEDEDVQP